MSDRVRAILIVFVIAAAVYAIPSGRNSADAVGAAFSALILAALVLFGARIYREHRGRLEELGDPHRIYFYVGLGSLVVALAARPQLVTSGPGTLLFIVLLLAPVAMLYAVWQRWREIY